LTAEVIEDVKRILPTVLYLETVADYIGVSRVSIHRWLKRGALELKRVRKDARFKVRQSEAIYVEFCNAVKKAKAEGEIFDAGVVKKAAAKQWQAAAWRLERRFPRRWGKKDQLDTQVSGKKDAPPVQVYLPTNGRD
jgi:transposase